MWRGYLGHTCVVRVRQQHAALEARAGRQPAERARARPQRRRERAQRRVQELHPVERAVLAQHLFHVDRRRVHWQRGRKEAEGRAKFRRALDT